MLTWWNAKITLYHKSANAENNLISWSRSTYNKCFWKGYSGQSRADLAEHGERRAIVRIPTDNIPVNIGDIVVLGDITDIIDEYTAGLRSKDLLDRYGDNAFTVELYQRNEPIGLGSTHYRLEGS